MIVKLAAIILQKKESAISTCKHDLEPEKTYMLHDPKAVEFTTSRKIGNPSSTSS